MKQFLQILSSLILTALFLPQGIQARDFTYTYEGQTLAYTVLDEAAKTCETKAGNSSNPGNNISGDLVIPEIAKDGDIEYSVIRIGEQSFYRSNGLISVTIPNSVRSMGSWAFTDCSGLTSVHIEDIEAWYEIDFELVDSNPLYNAHHLYLNGTEITNLSIPTSIEVIKKNTFAGCSGLNSITIPATVKSIGDCAFLYCSGVKELRIEDSDQTLSLGNLYHYIVLTRFTSGLFGDCPLETLYLGRNTTGYSAAPFSNQKNLHSLTIGNSVTEIGQSTFGGCSGLTSLSIPNSVIEIGQSAFNGCSGLTSLSIPNSVTHIGDAAFKDCLGLKELRFEDGPTTLTLGEQEYKDLGGYKRHGGLFKDCPLESVYLGRNLLYNSYQGSLGYMKYTSPFLDQKENLTSVTISNSVTSLKPYLFQGCSKLKDIAIPSSVKSIGVNAFSYIDNLGSLIIPSSVTDIINEGANYLRDLFWGTGIEELTILSTSAIIGLSQVDFINHLIVHKDASVDFRWDEIQPIIGIQSSKTQSTISFSFNPKTIKIIDDSGSEIDIKDAVGIPSGTVYNWSNNTLTYSNLFPGQRTAFNLLGNSFEEYSDAICISFNSENFADMVRANASFDSGDFPVTGYYWDYNNTHAYSVDVPWDANIKAVNFNIEGRDNFITSKSFDIDYPNSTLTDVEAVATALDKARLTARCNLSNGAIAGIEWRRSDAPDNVKSGEASCPVVAGMLMGELKGLRDDVYYKFRPYYERGDKRYYGDWIGFYTGDAGVYFEPEVGTLPATVSAGGIGLEGYAYAGTDDISAAGFEYRPVGSGSTRTAAGWQSVDATPNTYITVTLENLNSGTKYEYRAFAVAGGKTYYGATDEFTTPGTPARVEEIDAAEGFTLDAVLLTNPVVGSPKVRVTTPEGTARCLIHSIDGRLIHDGMIDADGNVEEIDVRLNRGLYILNIFGKSGRATFRLLAK